MEGTGGRSLETGAGRNGLVSGETPWSRLVHWGGAGCGTRQRVIVGGATSPGEIGNDKRCKGRSDVARLLTMGTLRRV